MSPDWLFLAASGLSGLASATATWAFLPLWDRFSSWYMTGLSNELGTLQIDRSRLPFILQLWGLSIIIITLVMLFWLRMPLIGVIIVIVIYRLPRIVARSLILKQRAKVRDQIVNACFNLANTARAGLPLVKGIEAILPETPEPLAAEFRRIVGEYNSGRPFAEALRACQNKLQLESMTLFTVAILACIERGGRVTDALDRIAKSLQENQRLQRKREADTASGLRVVQLLSIIPFGFLFLSYQMDPDGTKLVFQTVIGQIILAVSMVLVIVSVQWARAILKLDAAN